MAMIKEEDITAELINSKFPAVASVIVEDATKDAVILSTVTAEVLAEQNPDVYAEIKGLGFTAGEADGMSKGATAEAERLASIDAVAVVGYEAVISEMKKDTSKTATDAKLAIFDAMQSRTADAGDAVAADGKNLAAQAAELSGGNAEETTADDEKAAVAAMAAAGQKLRGE